MMHIDNVKTITCPAIWLSIKIFDNAILFTFHFSLEIETNFKQYLCVIWQ